ncbi:BMC domain-containing protein [Defluviitalea saccharophila]|uniref:BMC domain-containing protein n=1 Tax=Defluviitalea saccharophila TaxID=879970 RepID=A0ABZ2Y323_9FIRM|nr:BMC domain-containing protein [Candidatus Epulonipiscium sp.]
MKAEALGLIETKGLERCIEASDVMTKTADDIGIIDYLKAFI